MGKNRFQDPKTKKAQTRQERFVREYLADPELNGTKAAMKAGYARKGAHVTASRLLRRPKVQDMIRRLTEKGAKKLEIKAENVLAELALLAFSNMLDYIKIVDGQPVTNFSNLSRKEAAAIQEVTVDEYGGGTGDGERKQVVRTKFKLANKGENLERLGRHFKLFTDKLEVNGGFALLSDEELTKKLATLQETAK